MMKRLTNYLLVMFAALGISGAATAAPLLPGGVIFPAGDTTVTAPNTNGVVQNDNLISFSFGISHLFDVGGDVQNRVVESSSLGTMVFAPRIRDTFNIAFPSFEIFGFRLDGYAGWDTDVGYRTDGLGDKGPTSVSRSADGDLLTFRYGDPLLISGIAPGPQQESLFPYIVTDAPSYELTGSMTILGRNSAAEDDSIYSVKLTGLAVPTAGPATVPEPSALLLLGSGLLGLLGMTRKGSNSTDLFETKV
jgi:hypothetical protein